MGLLKNTFKFFGRMGIFFLSLAGLIFAVVMLVALYFSATNVTTEDIQGVEKSLVRVETALKEGGDFDKESKELKQVNEKLLAYLSALQNPTIQNKQPRQNIIDGLGEIAVNLAIAQNRMSGERQAVYSAVSELRRNLQELTKKIRPATTAEKMVSVVSENLVKLLTVIAWPLLLISILLYLVKSKRASQKVGEIFRPFKSVKLFAAEFVLSDEAKERAEETFDKYRAQELREYDAWVQRKSVEERLRTALQDILRLIDAARAALPIPQPPLLNYRCTIHVPDLIFADSFYQLLDYIPGKPGGQTRGRTFSVRFGFIGKVWRSQSSDVIGSVSTNTTDLVRDWGMTREEANIAASGRKSFLCVLLKYKKISIGMLYIDAPDQNEFGLDHDTPLLDSIAAVCDTVGLTEALASINEELRGRAPLIRIYTH